MPSDIYNMHLLHHKIKKNNCFEVCSFCRHIRAEKISTASGFLTFESAIVVLIKRDCPHRSFTQKNVHNTGGTVVEFINTIH